MALTHQQQLIAQWVEELFTNGQGEKADRLMLIVDGPPRRDLGGWSRGPVRDRLESLFATRPQPPDASLVAGVYMDRSIADFRRSCEVHIAEEQRKPSPDTALIALLCDAVRCSRELTALATKPVESPAP